MVADFFMKALDIVTSLKFRKVIFNEQHGGFKKQRMDVSMIVR